MNKLFQFKSENKKKQAGAVLLIVVAVAVLCEIFLFNFKFWDSLGSKPLNLTPTTVSGASQLDDTRYRIYKSDAYIEYTDINSELRYVRVSPETGYDTHIRFSATDEGNEYPLSAPLRSINTIVKPSQYIRLHFSGKVDTLKIELNNTSGTIINTDNIVLNTKVPMMFSLVRVILVTMFAMLLYILRPKSSVYGYVTDLRQKKQRIIAVVAVIIQTVVFIGMTFINSDALKWDDTEVHHRQYYNLIESFKSGSLSLGEGSESLKAMENPYDFNARVENEVEFNWDNAYFEGEYYSYFGVLPALLLHLPYNLITGGDLPNQIAVIIFGMALIIGIMLLLWEIIKKWFPRTPLVLYLMMSITFAVTSSLFYAVYKPDFYMVPPLAALSLSVFALALWTGAERDDGTLSVSRISWGGFFIALTSMCRPQFLVTLFFGVVLFWNNVFKTRTLFSKKSIKQTLGLCIPIILVAAVAMAYNYARFGSPLDFGANYNLTTNDMTKRGMVLGRTALGIFTYFFQPMRIDAQFPFVNDFAPATVYQGITITENQIGGAFMIFPILIYALVGIFKKSWFKDNLAHRIVCFSVIISFVVAILDTQMAGILMRYLTDFVWLLMIAATMTVFALHERILDGKSTLTDHRLRTLAMVLCGVSVAVGFLSIFCHSKNAVWWSNSIAYQYIKYIISFWL